MNIDRLLFQTFRMDVRSQAIYRLMFGCYLMLQALRENVGFGALARGDLYYPPLGPAMLMEAPPQLVFTGIRILTILLAFLLFIGFQSRITGISLSILMILPRLWIYSFGKVDHDIIFVLVPGVMAFSRWGEAFSVQALLGNRRVTSQPADGDAWPIAVLAIFVAFGMANSAWQKVVGGWLDPRSQATLGWMVFLDLGWHMQAYGFHFLRFLTTLPKLLTELLDILPILIECGFVVAIWRRRWFQLSCLLIVLFHFGTWFLLDVYFQSYLPVYAVFFPWDRIGGRMLGARLMRYLEIEFRRPLLLMILAVLILHLGANFPLKEFILYGGTGLAMVGVFVWIRELRPGARAFQTKNVVPHAIRTAG